MESASLKPRGCLDHKVMCFGAREHKNALASASPDGQEKNKKEACSWRLWAMLLVMWLMERTGESTV